MKITTFKVYAQGIFGLWYLIYQDTDRAKCEAVAAQHNKDKVSVLEEKWVNGSLGNIIEGTTIALHKKNLETVTFNN